MTTEKLKLNRVYKLAMFLRRKHTQHTLYKPQGRWHGCLQVSLLLTSLPRVATCSIGPIMTVPRPTACVTPIGVYCISKTGLQAKGCRRANAITSWYSFYYSAQQCWHCKRCTICSNSICLSVCPSDTRRHCVKTTARSTVQFALLDSKMCLVL